jgi:integrase/recombinase XerD
MSALREKLIQQMELKGYSQRTIKCYVVCIKAMSGHYNTPPDLLSNEQIREYIQQRLVEKKLSKSWVNQMVSALKLLYVDILRREWDHIAIPRPRRERKLPVVFSREEVKMILSRTENLRHRAILMVVYSGGLRLGEVRSLKVTDIDSSRMQIRVVQAKGNKDRYTILSPVVLGQLRAYWKKYRTRKWLFETPAGQQVPERTVQHMFKKALKRSEVRKNCGIHSLRHSFATHLMEQGVALPVIQQLMGHKSLRTTSGYLHVQQYALETVKSPLDSL